jgi:hypothetical protein
MLSSDGAALTVEESYGLFSCSRFRKVREDLEDKKGDGADLRG